MERTVRTPDGRILAVHESGDRAGRPVLVHNGTPMSRHLYGPNVADAAEQGLRLISYDRPGYGGSTPQPGRSVADSAADVKAICDALEIGKLAMWGFSGGGPRVLACEMQYFVLRATGRAADRRYARRPGRCRREQGPGPPDQHSVFPDRSRRRSGWKRNPAGIDLHLVH